MSKTTYGYRHMILLKLYGILFTLKGRKKTYLLRTCAKMKTNKTNQVSLFEKEILLAAFAT